jgi:hypothetical protein
MPAHYSLSPDRSIFMVLCRYGGGSLAWAERDAARTCRAATVEDIIKGELAAIVQIIEFNIAENWSRDVTEELMAEAPRPDDLRSRHLSELAEQDHMNRMIREWVNV